MRLSEEKITRGNAVAVKAAVLASFFQRQERGFDDGVDSDVVGACFAECTAYSGNPMRAGKNALADEALRR